MPTIYDVAAQFRGELLARDVTARRDMVREYRAVQARIEHDLRDLAAAIERRRDSLAPGQRLPVSWLYQEARLGEVRDGVARELRRWAGRVEPNLGKARGVAGTMGAKHAGELIRARALTADQVRNIGRALVPFRPELVEQVMGTLQRDSPLRDLLDDMGPRVARNVERELVQGVALGKGPVDLAREVRGALEGGAQRAELIARTEVLRAYRETTRARYMENGDLLDGWRWWSSLDRRSCASCWAMHGSLHRVDERLDDHPAGRCSMIPELRRSPGMAQAPIEPGPSRFARLDPDSQRRILGPGKWDDYASGRIELGDVVRQVQHPRWGSMRSVATRYGARVNAARRGGPPAVRPPQRRPAPPGPPPRPPVRAPAPEPAPPAPGMAGARAAVGDLAIGQSTTVGGVGITRVRPHMFSMNFPDGRLGFAHTTVNAKRARELLDKFARTPAGVPTPQAIPTPPTLAAAREHLDMSDLTTGIANPARGGAALEEAIDDAFDVMGLRLPPPTRGAMPVRIKVNSRSEAAYVQDGRGPTEIQMSTTARGYVQAGGVDTPGGRAKAALDFAHEFGHYLDNAVLREWSIDVAISRGRPTAVTSWATDEATDGAMRALMVTIRASPGYRRIVGMRSTLQPSSWKYLTSGKEAFARAFAQYVAERSGRPEWVHYATHPPDYIRGAVFDGWGPDEGFDEIAAAFDALFRERGWMQ